MSDQIQILKFLFVQNWKPLEDSGVISSDEKFANTPEILTYIQSGEKPSLVLCSLGSKNDLIQIATLAKIMKKAKDLPLKVAVVNFCGNKQFEMALQKLGILDIIDPSVTPKALKFKLNLWTKNLTATSNKSSFQMKSLKSSETQKANEKKVVESNSTFLPAMKTPDDIWIHQKEFECKKILGRWLIRLMGPSPYVAQWVEVENKPGVWKFEFREGQRTDFLSGSGNWFFKGDQKPDFNWKENIWYFSGENVDLFYFDEEVFPRIQLKNRQLAICENSQAAVAKESVIRDSFDKDLVFKKDVERLSNLEGEGGTDEIDGSTQLAEGGKSAKNEAEEIQGKLKGKSETTSQEGYLKSKDGKSESTGEDSQKALSKDNKPSESPRFHNLHGKGKTDQLNQSELKNKKVDEETSEADKFLERSDKKLEEKIQNSQKPKPAVIDEKQFSDLKKALPEKEREGDKGGSYAGKSQTDNEGPGHYQNKNPQQQSNASESKDAKPREASAAKEYNDLGGKGKTDHLNNPNLQGKSKAEGDIGTDPLALKLKEQEKKQPGFASMKNVAEELKDLGGKGKTDHISQKDLSGKNKGEGDIGTDPLALKLNEAEKKKGNLGGKSSTDHYDHTGKKGAGSGAHREGDLQDYENKNHAHETKYKGHLEAEKFDAKEGRKNQYREDEQDGYMGGEHNTDRLKKNYGTKEDSAVGTDKLDRSALGARLKKALEEEKARSPHLAKELERKARDQHSLDVDIEFEEESEGNVLPFQKPEFDAAALRDLKETLHDPTQEANDLLQTAILKAKITKDDVTQTCKFDDFFEGTMIFEFSVETSFSEDVGVDLELDYAGRKVNLKLAGVVTSSESHSGATFLSVQVNEKESEELSEFMNIYEARQRDITNFLMKVKGL